MAEVGPTDLGVAMLVASLSTGTGGTDRHHVWPKYLGGALTGLRILLDRATHQAYHAFLDKHGLPRQIGKAAYDRMIAEGRGLELLRDLVRLTKEFDRLNGTRLAKELMKVFGKSLRF